MRISGTEPSAVIFTAKQSSFKILKVMLKKFRNKLKPKGIV